ncbi:MAG: DUF2384 domain-containing protein [Gammaproteobacteria bacterium]|nr:DUF2384 domain-containing protein [Gammaproteobacteria bacterium]
MKSSKEKVIRKVRDLKLAVNDRDAERWLLKERIPSLEDKTAAELILQGNADAVLEYLENVATGGYA